MNMLNKLLSVMLGIEPIPEKDIRKEVSEQIEIATEKETDEEKVVVPNFKAQSGARVIFSISSAGEVNIQMQWSDSSDEVAEALGTLLHFINGGKLDQQCEAVLNGTMQSAPQQRSFVKKVAKYWENALKGHEQIVKPSEVFQVGRQNSNLESNGMPTSATMKPGESI